MNEVLFPVELSLFQMPPAELRVVVETMERDESGIAATLGRLRPVWDGQLAALRHRLEVLDGGQVQFVRPWRGGVGDASDWELTATATLTEWVGDQQPARLQLDRGSGSAKLSGEPNDFLIGAGVLDAHGPDDVVQCLTRVLDRETVPQRPSSSLVNDLVLGEDDGNHPLQLRVAWSDVHEQSTILIAVRNPPPPPVLPDDPLGALTDWCGEEHVLVLTCDADDRVVGVAGEPAVLGFDHENTILGMTSDELVGSLGDRFGPADLQPGPSGRRPTPSSHSAMTRRSSRPRCG